MGWAVIFYRPVDVHFARSRGPFQIIEANVVFKPRWWAAWALPVRVKLYMSRSGVAWDDVGGWDRAPYRLERWLENRWRQLEIRALRGGE